MQSNHRGKHRIYDTYSFPDMQCNGIGLLLSLVLLNVVIDFVSQRKNDWNGKKQQESRAEGPRGTGQFFAECIASLHKLSEIHRGQDSHFE
ncbi:MAG: hypothetical protein AB8B97_05960 [Granulosicoccus sp.]